MKTETRWIRVRCFMEMRHASDLAIQVMQNEFMRGSNLCAIGQDLLNKRTEKLTRRVERGTCRLTLGDLKC